MKKYQKLLNKPYFNERSKRWEIRFSGGTNPETGKRVRHVITHKTKTGVKQKAIAFLKEQELNTVPATGLTVATYLRKWHKDSQYTWSPRTNELYLHQIEKHIIPHIGHHQLEELKPHHVRSMVADIAAEGLLSTANKCRRLVWTAMEDAADSDLIPKNPVKTVKPVKEQPRKIRILEPHETRKFLDATKGHRLYAAFYLLIATGLRRGELLGLSWDDVTEDGLLIRNALKLVGNEPVLGPLKTKKSRRFVALSQDVLDVLSAHRDRQEEERRACYGSWTETGLVFTTKIGTPIHPRNLLHILKNEQEKAGVPVTSIHSFRHMNASLLITNDLDIKSISERLGHSSTSFTMDRYGHILQEHRHKSALTVSQLLGETQAEEPSPENEPSDPPQEPDIGEDE